MDPGTNRIALLYDDDGYVEATGQPPQPGSECRTGVIGRQVAGKEFLDAYLSHGSWTELIALVRNQPSADSLVHIFQTHPALRARRRGLQLLAERDFHRTFFPTPLARLIYTPCPPDLRYAWARQHKGPGTYALSGVTHTLCSQRALEWLSELVTAPFEPYDSLICTSRAVVNLVRAASDAYVDYLRDRHGGQPRGRIHLELIPLGVNTDKFRPPSPEERATQRRVLQATDDEVVVLFVGRLAHHGKAHPFPMYRALGEAARRTGHKVHLVLVGWAANTAIMDAFHDGAQSFAPGVRVTFVDGNDPRTRFGVWHAADIFTSLSDNIQETFGLVLVEALASGLPVVASDWDGYRDLVADGETGFLVPTIMVGGATADATSRLQLEEINYDHFLAECSQAAAVDCVRAAEAFTRLIDDEALRRRMGEAGRRRALAQFAWPRIIAAYEALWRNQERERQAYLRSRPDTTRSYLGPARYAAIEHSFAGYPTRWLNDDDLVQATPEALDHLNRCLTMPLVNYEAETRVHDAALLRQVLTATAAPISLRQVEAILTRAGIETIVRRATLAWLFKYDLLRLVGSADEHRARAEQLRRQGHLSEAVQGYREVLRLRPGDLKSLIELGMTRAAQGQLDEALGLLNEVLKQQGESADGYSNLGAAASLAGQYDLAVSYYEQALRLQPHYAEVHWNLALALLVQGDFARGWQEYEWRWKCKGMAAPPTFSQPQWDGTPLAGRPILLQAEQGMGDTIQFIRYARLVQERGGRVIFLCPRSLAALLTGCPGIDELISDAARLPPFAVHAPLLSLPRIFGTMPDTIPAAIPYLSARPQLVEYWRRELEAVPGFRVGIAWQGNPSRPWDHPHRSIPLARFEPLAQVTRNRLISLQKGVGTEQVQTAPFDVTVLPGLQDERAEPFLNEAAVLGCLDLFITCDTALAHLAGALGVPVWLGLSCAADWRWLLKREDTPWYPTMRLFRRKSGGDWTELFERMAGELRRRLTSPQR
jgi:glycosyltransferase involved in cell wall biosynthesis